MRETPVSTSNDPSQRDTRKRWHFLILGLLVVSGALLALSRGYAPDWVYAAAPLNLADRAPMFLDVRLAALGRHETLCKKALSQPALVAEPINDRVSEKGCGWRNAVRVERAANARSRVSELTCEAAVAMAMWMTHSVQPAARQHFGVEVTNVQIGGGYACRNIIGSPLFKLFRSQHASANAIDVFGFTFADGRSVSLKKDWAGDSNSAKFLKQVRSDACFYFRVVLSPDYNAAHKDHFHLDRGTFKACR
jgi:hypothetical protein